MQQAAGDKIQDHGDINGDGNTDVIITDVIKSLL